MCDSTNAAVFGEPGMLVSTSFLAQYLHSTPAMEQKTNKQTNKQTIQNRKRDSTLCWCLQFYEPSPPLSPFQVPTQLSPCVAWLQVCESPTERLICLSPAIDDEEFPQKGQQTKEEARGATDGDQLLPGLHTRRLLKVQCRKLQEACPGFC